MSFIIHEDNKNREELILNDPTEHLSSNYDFEDKEAKDENADIIIYELDYSQQNGKVKNPELEDFLQEKFKDGARSFAVKFTRFSKGGFEIVAKKKRTREEIDAWRVARQEALEEIEAMKGDMNRAEIQAFEALRQHKKREQNTLRAAKRANTAIKKRIKEACMTAMITLTAAQHQDELKPLIDVIKAVRAFLRNLISRHAFEYV